MQYGDDAIALAAVEPLEKWDNTYRDYVIHLEHPEFSSLCPRSGYPDFGTIVIDYIPDRYVLELKAFKLYINSFREKRISHENVINTIADRFVSEIAPVSLRAIGDFSRRGGVKTVITTTRGEAYPFDRYTPNLL